VNLCSQYLFAKRGFDAEKLQQRLESIDIKATYEPLEQIAETDLDSYLRHEEQLLINAAIEEAKREV
jgi:nuclear pore complex protein Nup93